MIRVCSALNTHCPIRVLLAGAHFVGDDGFRTRDRCSLELTARFQICFLFTIGGGTKALTCPDRRRSEGCVLKCAVPERWGAHLCSQFGPVPVPRVRPAFGLTRDLR